MIFKNIKTFIKHLSQNKLYSFITILGFSVSLMFIILLSVYIQKEYSYDHFHVNKDRIFRVGHDDEAGLAPPSGALLVDKFPEVKSYTRIYKQGGFVSALNDEKVKINFLMADSTFFTMFSFRLISGMPETVLKENKSIVLSRSYALKLFGRLPELGQTLNYNSLEYKITGIMEDFPENTHFQKVDAIIDFPSLAEIWGFPPVLTTFDNNSFGLYVLAHENTNLPAKAPEMFKLFKEVNWMFKEFCTKVVLEPLTDIYFGNLHSPGIKQNSKTLLKVLSAIALMILFLSVLNYINLTTAQSAYRSKEIAIKKLMGGKKAGIVMQYALESVLFCVLSYIIALFLCFLVEPVFNYLLNTNLELASAFNWQFVLYSYIIAILIGIVSGIIPAIAISNFNPVEVVKGAFRMKGRGVYSRVFISFQYLIIISLIISSLFISRQTQFLRNYELGYNKENIIWIDNQIEPKQQETFKTILKSISGVEHVCYVMGNPMDGGNNNSFDYNGKFLSFQSFRVDTSFFRMMGMQLNPTGVAFSEGICCLNESGVKAMELPDNPKFFKLGKKEFPVYGVVKDFHFRNLKEKIGPAYFRLQNPGTFHAWSILVKVSGGNTIATIDKIKAEHKKFTHGRPMTMGFMDETVNQWYEKEEKVGKIVKYFTFLTIIISVMGLFAMSLFYIQQKTKEIGVRKVNGAKISEVLAMLNKDFMKWVIIAFVIACPVAYYAMNKWLENFAYKTTLSWWIFALAGVLALGIALLTVSWQSWRAATRNPVEALRYE